MLLKLKNLKGIW